MKRREILLGATALGACGMQVPINGRQTAPALMFEDNAPTGFVRVTDVAQTDLAGTVIYDEVIPFDAGQFTPPGPTTPTGSGGRIKGAVQSRVVRSTNRNTLIFAYRFRDLQFWPAGPQGQGGQNVNVEIVTLRGFPRSAFPVEVYHLDQSQSLGAEVLELYARGNGGFEANTFLTEPGGTTFAEILTRATGFTTGKYLSFEIDTRMNVGGQVSVTLDGIAIPA